MPESQLSAETYETIDHIVRIGNVAVAKAQEESRRMGVPNVYSINESITKHRPVNCLLLTLTPMVASPQNNAMNGSGNKRAENGASTHRPVIATVHRSGHSHEGTSLALMADASLAKPYVYQSESTAVTLDWLSHSALTIPSILPT